MSTGGPGIRPDPLLASAVESARLAVLWHDIECGAYTADLPVWRELVQRHPLRDGPVLDIGAGTGRVALDLAAQGHDVVAVDLDAALLATLSRRARDADLTVTTHVADARSLESDAPALQSYAPFRAVLVPMQTIQLLGGPAGRGAALASAGALLAPGGLVAVAIAEALDVFDIDAEGDWNVLPDLREIDGTVYASCPTAVRDRGDQVALERQREIIRPDGTRVVSGDLILLDRLTPDPLEAEGRAAGLDVLPRRTIDPTEDHIGSTVVMFGA